MTKLELAIFDYDGVIADTFADVHASYEVICRELGGKYARSLEEFKRQYRAANNHTQLLLNLGITAEKHAQADVIFKRFAASKETLFYEGIMETLTKLHNKMPLVIASSNHKTEIIAKLAEANLLPLFSQIFGCETDGVYFHKQEPIRQSVLRYAHSPDRAVMIGDRDIDFTSARQAGLPAKNVILVDYGWFYDRTAREKEGYCLQTRVKKPADILTAVREIEAK